MSAGQEFLEKLEAAEAKIRAESDKMTSLREKLPDENREDISSRIDMAVGSASLILAGKCKQFRELCQKNINENSGVPADSIDGKKSEGAQFPTTREDLEGFWEMISLPIQKVRDDFSSIERLKENGWKENEDTIKKTEKKMSASFKAQELNRKKPLASKNDNTNPNDAIDAERREKIARQKEEARQRLLKFKQAARDKLSQQNADNINGSQAE